MDLATVVRHKFGGLKWWCTILAEGDTYAASVTVVNGNKNIEIVSPAFASEEECIEAMVSHINSANG